MGMSLKMKVPGGKVDDEGQLSLAGPGCYEHQRGDL